MTRSALHIAIRGMHRMLVAMAHVRSSIVNPLVKLAFRFGIPDPGDALLETTATRTGKPRLTPVCEGLDGEMFWLIAERGRETEWMRDIRANPRVRVKPRSRRPAAWRSGVAHILDGDDARRRRRRLSRAGFWRELCLRTSAALATDPVTVRIDLDPAPPPRTEER